MNLFKTYPRDDGSFYSMASKCINPFDNNHAVDVTHGPSPYLLKSFPVNAELNNFNNIVSLLDLISAPLETSGA